MPNPQKRKPSKKQKGPGINPPESTVVYNGPLKLPMGESQRALITSILHFGPSVLTSSGAGAISNVSSDNPSGCVDWGSFASLWDEYRVLGLTLFFEPYNKYNQPTTTIVGPIFTIIDRDDATALTTEAQMLEFESLKVFNLANRFKRSVRMASIEDASFITTMTPVARNWIKIVSTGLTASTNYGKFWADVLIQFRGRN